MKFSNNQQGFAVGTILLVVVLMAAIVGAIAMGSRSSTGDASTQTAKVNASSVIQQGINLKSSFDIMIAKGAKTIDQITFDAVAGTGVFNPTDGGGVMQTAPSAAQSAATDWAFSKSGGAVVKLPGMGTTAAADYLVYLANVNAAVCLEATKALYGNSATVVAAGVATAAFVAATDLTGVAGMNNRSADCVQTTDGYVYYQVVSEK